MVTYASCSSAGRTGFFPHSIARFTYLVYKRHVYFTVNWPWKRVFLWRLFLRFSDTLMVFKKVTHCSICPCQNTTYDILVYFYTLTQISLTAAALIITTKIPQIYIYTIHNKKSLFFHNLKAEQIYLFVYLFILLLSWTSQINVHFNAFLSYINNMYII